MAATRTIELRTEIPGPRSREVLARLAASVSPALAITFPVVAADARGALITDVDGNVFIDFTGGVGCLNVGHAHPHVVAAAQEQLERFAHTDFTVVPYEIYATLAERLLARAPFTGPAKAAFFNAGTEAVENAVKFARLYTGRSGRDRLRGRLPRAHAAVALAHLEDASVQAWPRPVRARGLPGAVPERLPRPLDRRGARRPASARSSTLVAPENVAAIVVEPVQGEGGFIPAPAEFLQGLREICDRHGIVLVVDEVQTGFARTGRFFAVEHSGVEPDLITVAKSIAMGLPLSGVLGKAEIMDAAHEGAVGGTFVGNPVAIAAALAVLDVIEDEGLVERANAIGETIRARMESWQARWPQIGDVRGVGAMLAIELVTDPETKEPAADLATRVIDAATARGLLLLRAGAYGNCIRVLVPLVIGDAELDEALGVWEDALATSLR